MSENAAVLARSAVAVRRSPRHRDGRRYATACTATNSFPSAPSPAASAPMSTASGACRSAPAIWLSSTRSRRMPATPSPIAVGRTSCSISISLARRAAAGTARRRRRPFCSVQPTAQPRSGAVPRPEPALCAADGSAVLRAGKQIAMVEYFSALQLGLGDVRQPETLAHTRLEAAAAFIDAHCTRPLTLDDICRAAALLT